MCTYLSINWHKIAQGKNKKTHLSLFDDIYKLMQKIVE